MVSPTCPSGYTLNKSTCRCNKTKKLPKNKKNKFAAKKTVAKKTVAKKTVAKKTVVKTEKKRCPNGTRKNPKTLRCVKKIMKEKKVQKNNIQIKKNNEEFIADAFRSMHPAVLKGILQTDINSRTRVDQLLTTIRKETIKNKSFSPNINKVLVSLHPGTHQNFFGCGLSLNNIKNEKFMVNVGTKIVNGVKQPICVSSDSKKAKNLFLDNLRKINTIDCNNIIAPLQIKSNCWFNTMFMCLFISDKGRKFFRFFRQLMIEGKLADGKSIPSKKLKRGLFLLNACIEASYNVANNDMDTKKALLMDTNNVIKLIYESIPKKSKYDYHWIRDVGDSGNPYYYYSQMIQYLGIDAIQMRPLTLNDISYIYDHSTKGLDVPITDKLSYLFKNIAPDICVVTLNDDTSNINKSLEFTIVNGSDKITYRLDSIIIRNTEQEHFSCVLTCNGEEKAFDGASIGRLRNFKWKQLISENTVWTFSYGKTFSHYSDMRWNFMNGYQMLFYYRIN